MTTPLHPISLLAILVLALGLHSCVPQPKMRQYAPPIELACLGCNLDLAAEQLGKRLGATGLENNQYSVEANLEKERIFLTLSEDAPLYVADFEELLKPGIIEVHELYEMEELAPRFERWHQLRLEEALAMFPDVERSEVEAQANPFDIVKLSVDTTENGIEWQPTPIIAHIAQVDMNAWAHLFSSDIAKQCLRTGGEMMLGKQPVYHKESGYMSYEMYWLKRQCLAMSTPRAVYVKKFPEVHLTISTASVQWQAWSQTLLETRERFLGLVINGTVYDTQLIDENTPPDLLELHGNFTTNQAELLAIALRYPLEKQLHIQYELATE